VAGLRPKVRPHKPVGEVNIPCLIIRMALESQISLLFWHYCVCWLRRTLHSNGLGPIGRHDQLRSRAS
jgi:hypothetical protein